MADDYLWDPAAEPDPEIAKLEELVNPAGYRPTPFRGGRAMPRRLHLARWAAVAAVLVAAVATVSRMRHVAAAPWAVVTSRGTPVVRDASGAISGESLVRGGVLETDSRSEAVLNVGRIGRARLGPDSRLRLVSSGATENRLALDRGTMHASVTAPPRYFLVETAGALAVDLGCVYTITTDVHGAGLLTVQEGEVELQRGTVRSSVLAGNAASLSANGPGLPHPVDASPALERAVAAYDADPARPAALDDLLAASDSRTTITLWHLLQRVDSTDRGRVFDRLAAIAPPPRTVTRDRILRGESGALQRWRTDLQRSWATEPPLWRRMLLTLDLTFGR
jgi:hypothetical protein